MSHPKYREIVGWIFKSEGYKLVLKPTENTFEIQRDEGDIAISYPYAVLSDTLQRMIFYTMAIESNKDATLIFEEPESFAFPYYVKWLGEKIGYDKSNQYFIATHNPYLLSAIVEKTPVSDLNVFITYKKNYQTRVVSLNSDQIADIMSWDPFLNLKQFIPEDDA
jgi:AAA15 family ATPase/GTPase